MRARRLRTRWFWVVAVALLAMLATACGSDDGENNAASTSAQSGTSATPGTSGDVAPPEPDDAGSAGSGDGSFGTVVLGDETITFVSARCFLEEQDAAGGGGKILFVVQGFGLNAAGEDVALDVSRYDADSQFAGDKVNLVVGDPFSGDAISWDANEEAGTVTIDGSNASADNLTFVNFDEGAEQAGSFNVNC